MNYKQDITDYAHVGDFSSLKKMIEKEGVDNIDVYDLYKVMIISCQKNYEDIAKYILSLNRLDDKNINNALNCSVEHNNIEIVKIIINEESNFEYVRSLAISVRENNKDIFNLLLPVCTKEEQVLDALKVAIIKGHNDMVDILMPLFFSNQEKLDDFMRTACTYNNEYIIDKLIPHCKDLIFTNQPLNWAMGNINVNAKIINKLLEFSNKDELEDTLFTSIIYSKKEAIDILFDYCDVVLIKDKVIESKLEGKGADYFLQKIDSVRTKLILQRQLMEVKETKNEKSKPKVM